MALAGADKVAAAVVVVVVCLALPQQVSGHAYEFGTCKNIPGAQNFQPDQLTGVWYVIKIFSTNSRCMTVTFNRTADGFTATERRELFLGRKVGLDHILTNTGYFTIKNDDVPAQMSVSWPSNFLGPADVTVVDIERDSFAVIYECKSLFVVRRTSAVILSRQPALDPTVIERIEGDLSALKIDVTDFDVMNHADCNQPGEADFNFNVNEYIGDGFIKGGQGGGQEGGQGGQEGEGEGGIGIGEIFNPEFINFDGVSNDENEVQG
ncbi:apolipoprotein D-like [Portunus trituberculatus]|uniref:apolipoprotein D-like n=1 Tax=Portunus trituberculatus TaxID=210409 RepID=UPI001E1CF788|nr:apolipoprotein D-like [Portunus trituberculatus]